MQANNNVKPVKGISNEIKNNNLLDLNFNYKINNSKLENQSN